MNFVKRQQEASSQRPPLPLQHPEQRGQWGKLTWRLYVVIEGAE